MKPPQFVDIDFEFNETVEPKVNLVCCSLKLPNERKARSYWLSEEDSKENLITILNHCVNNNYIFRCYSAVAEGRCFHSLGINPTKVQWFDLFLEYRNLLNHSDLQFGKQLIDGKIHRNPPNRFDKRFKKPEDNLAACIYKLLNIQIDTEHKEYMRDIIIDGRYVEENKEDIIKYCESDIRYLDMIYKEMVRIYKIRLTKNDLMKLKDQILLRGEYAARTAIMESLGYPINYEATRNFSRSVQDILNEIAEDINEQFPDILPFEKNRATRKYVFKQDKAREQVRKYCSENAITNWERSEKTGNYSLSVDAYSKFFHYRHDFPRGNYFAQVLRYKKAEQHMNGFKPKKKPSNYWPGTDILKNKDKSNKLRKTFFDSVGSDKRVRPYFNIYGAQSSRSQPAARGYLFLKAAWMRALCEPPKGRCMIAIDYGQQEFLLKGLMSKDKNMIKAYESGDVYLYFGKEANEIPKEANKSHPLRDKFKATVLAIQFLMSKFGLAKKLTNDTGNYTTEDEAQELIDMFYTVFRGAEEHSYEILEEYYNGKGQIQLPCGWTMWDKNPNERSVANMPVQGFGASIMRMAVRFAQEANLDVVLTLHDAIYIESDIGTREENTRVLAMCMDKAFRHYFKNKEGANIRLDGNIWSRELENKDKEYNLKYYTEYGEFDLPIKQQKIYIDGRSKSEYEKFSKYFEDRFCLHLL